MQTNEVKEVASEIIGWEGNKVFRTIIDLTRRPGQTISAYCQGEKQKYLSPVIYYFTVSGVTYYLQSLTIFENVAKDVETWKKLFLTQFNTKLESEKMDNVIAFIFNPTIRTTLVLPFTLLITWFLFKKYNSSFKQNSWYTLFVTAHAGLLLSLVYPLYWLPNKTTYLVLLGIVPYAGIGYSIWAAKQFYQINVGKAILLTLLRAIILLPITAIVFGVMIYLVYSFS